MSVLRVDELTTFAGTGLITIPQSSRLWSGGSIAQVVTKTFNDSTTNASAQTYVAVANGSLSIEPKFSGSLFFIRLAAQGYQAGGGGMNVAIRRDYISNSLIIGVAGSGGDSWMGSNNGTSTNSANFKRSFFDSPGASPGTIITYTVMLGSWSTNTAFFNYPGYTGGSTITIMEIAR